MADVRRETHVFSHFTIHVCRFTFNELNAKKKLHTIITID